MDLHPILLQMLPLLAVVGTYLVILGYDYSGLPDRVRTRGTKTTGTVIEIRPAVGGLFGSKPAVEGDAPVVDFTTPWGSHRHYSTQYQLPCPYRVGDQVELWYYFRKSRREVLLAGEDAGDLPGKLYRWGFAFCLVGYPFLLKKLMLLVG